MVDIVDLFPVSGPGVVQLELHSIRERNYEEYVPNDVLQGLHQPITGSQTLFKAEHLDFILIFIPLFLPLTSNRTKVTGPSYKELRGWGKIHCIVMLRWQLSM